MLAFPKSWKGVLQQNTFFYATGWRLPSSQDSEARHLLVCFSLENISVVSHSAPRKLDSTADGHNAGSEGRGYRLICHYLLAGMLGQMLEWHLESVALPFLDPRRFLSQVLAESGSLTVSDLADVEFFSPQWHSFNRRGGEWPTQEHPIAWQLQHSPRRWEMWIGYPLGKEGNCGRSKFNLGECLSLKAIV